MDFADFDLRAASERGSWVHLKAPRDGKTGDGVEFKQGDLLYVDQVKQEGPARVLIKGFADKGVMEAYNRHERLQMLLQHRMGRTADKDAEAVIAKHQDDLKEAMDALVVAAVADLENITENGKPMKCEPESVLKYFGFGAMFYSQVHAAITDQHRLFTSADSA
jgi:hypothetical protein